MVFSREDAEDCARWILSEVATRTASKHQKAPLVAVHISRQPLPKYLRGSDLSERLYASTKILKRAGYTEKEALPIVAERAQKYLGTSNRGRRSSRELKRDLMSTLQTVRSMVNAFAKRKQHAVSAVNWWVDKFEQERTIGASHGSEYDPQFGQRMHEAWLERKEQLRRLGVIW